MRKKLIAGAVVAICLTLFIGSTIAYFTHENTATNVITSGNIKIDLQEFHKTENDQLIPFENLPEEIVVMPAQVFSKIVIVENTGNNAAYIRIKIDKSIVLADGVQGTPDTELVSLDFDTENWEKIGDYYYYKKTLEPGKTTEPLFENVTFAPEMGNMYQGSKAVIKVNAQATQVKNNGNNVFEAAGWPESK